MNESKNTGNSSPLTGMGVTLILLWVLVLMAFNTRERPEQHHSQKHPVFSDTMKHGGDGRERHSDLLVTGWAFGSTQFVLFTGLLGWATCLPKRPRLPPRLWLFVVGGLIIEAAFTFLCWSYYRSLDDPVSSFIGPFPPGLSWLLFGVWLAPGFLITMYVLNFNDWIYSESDKQVFEKLKRDFPPAVATPATDH